MQENKHILDNSEVAACCDKLGTCSKCRIVAVRDDSGTMLIDLDRILSEDDWEWITHEAV